MSARVEWHGAIPELERHFGADDDGRVRPCPLPGHKRHAQFGVPPNDPDGDVRLLCCSGRWQSLGGLRLALAIGRDEGGRPHQQGGPTNILLATWERRLAYEVGVFQPVPVELPRLPESIDPASLDAANAVRDGLTLLFGLRWADWERRPVAWAIRFAALWCEISERDAAVGTRIAIEHGLVNEVDRNGSLALYMPGSLPGDSP